MYIESLSLYIYSKIEKFLAMSFIYIDFSIYVDDPYH